MNFIKEHCFQALKNTFQDQIASIHIDKIEITPSTQAKFGHYQCNSAMKLNKILGRNPREIALTMTEEIKKRDTAHFFANIDIAGPGFINFTFSPEFLSKRLNEIILDPRLGVPLASPALNVIIDFSAPNIAKDMHVGHLRSTIIGDCLARVFHFLGHTVLRLNHVGDWGTQFGMIIAHLKTVLPNIAESSVPDIDLSDLVGWYRAAKKRFDEEPEFKQQAQREVVALQSHDETSIRIWQLICAISQKAYQKIYALLDIQILDRGESFYNPLLPTLIQDLEQKGMITVSQGAKCIYLEDFKNREGDPLPLMLQKSDGGYNYATTDMAALRHRVQDERGDWIIIVTDSGQSLHFQMIFEAAEKAGYYDPNKVRIDHVPLGLVLRSDGKKFKTRSGDTEKLIDLLNNAISKARELLIERTPDISETDLERAAHVLGINAVKYSDLACHRLSDYVFSYDKMLKFEGNTAAFLLYAYVRTQSIQRKINISISDLLAQNQKIILNDPTEIALGLVICQFPEVLENMSRDLLPNRLTDYLYSLAEKFHAFFHQCRVEGSTEQNSRVLLCEAVRRTLHQGFELLGLKPLERM